MKDSVLIHEMAPRDGLQNEKRLISTADKIRLVDLLSAAGLKRIEVTSFVRADWVPQMADAKEVMAGITRRPGTDYTALAPNLRGFEAALAARADRVAVFAAASESFSRKNINCTIEESIERFRPVMEAAARAGIPVRGYVSCVTDCPYEGPVDPQAVARVALMLDQLGCHEISLGETLGRASSEQVEHMLEAVLEVVPASRLAGHFHDTGGAAIAHIELALRKGLRVFDASAGGLGGCPYAPGAAGNVATGAVLALLSRLGFETGIDAARLAIAETFARSLKETR